MTAKALRFNNSEYKTGLDEAMQTTIAEYCEPSFEGISNDSDLYAIDYVIEVMCMKKRTMIPHLHKNAIKTVNGILERLTALQENLDYISIDKLHD